VVRREGGAAGVPAGAAGAGDATVNAQAVARAIAERRFDLRRAVGDLERAALEAALAAAGGSAAGAARLLGRVGRGGAHDPGGTVRAMMRRLGVAWGAGEPRAGSRAGGQPRAAAVPAAPLTAGQNAADAPPPPEAPLTTAPPSMRAISASARPPPAPPAEMSGTILMRLSPTMVAICIAEYAAGPIAACPCL
jgi:hypothetical protein